MSDKAGGMADKELSRAVVAYLRGAELPFAHQSMEAVVKVLGATMTARPVLEPGQIGGYGEPQRISVRDQAIGR